MNPDAGLYVQRAARHCVGNFLKIGQAEKLDVIDGEAAVRDRRGNRRETQRLEGLVQLQEDRRATLLVRPPDEVETKAFPGAGKFREKSEISRDLRAGVPPTYRWNRCRHEENPFPNPLPNGERRYLGGGRRRATVEGHVL